jgi:hypothetical protein
MAQTPDITDTPNNTDSVELTITIDIAPSVIIDTSQTVNNPPSRTRDTSQGINSLNIITQPRVRKPRKEAYLAALDSVTELTAYHTAFTAGTQFNPQFKTHRSDLPVPPTN